MVSEKQSGVCFEKVTVPDPTRRHLMENAFPNEWQNLRQSEIMPFLRAVQEKTSPLEKEKVRFVECGNVYFDSFKERSALFTKRRKILQFPYCVRYKVMVF